jgi:catechol 2,3-dioxygenase-like lactoylglutathione lyase family enzyme
LDLTLAAALAVGTVTYLVRDYDEAVRYFTGLLGFELIEDALLEAGKRWVLVAPRSSQGAALLLAKAVNEEQAASIGRQAGGRVFLFLRTDDFERDHAAMRARGVRFLEEPRQETYGTVAVFEDLYGNRWDLIEPAE